MAKLSPMRAFEDAFDHKLPPEQYIAVRLDGRHFHALTDEMGYQKPFDTSFHDAMTSTTKQLVSDSGFDIHYAYTQSDEINLLIAANDLTFARRQQKIVSVLAGATSSIFCFFAKTHFATFDARVNLLPSSNQAARYFRWRQEDATRNSLNGLVFWLLVENGMSEREATQLMIGKNAAWKHELLHSRWQMNWNDLEDWQKRGSGFYWERYTKRGYNPIKQQAEYASRRRVAEIPRLLYGDAYEEQVKTILAEAP